LQILTSYPHFTKDYAVDTLDSQIIYELARDGRQTNSDLAARIGLSASACLRRVKTLEESGVIMGYTAVINPDMVDRGTMMVIRASFEKADRATIESFRAAVRNRPEVMFCALMLSTPDLIMHVRVKNVPEFEKLYLDHLATLPGVTRLESQLVIEIISHQAPVSAP
jgi:Lrp/AsnC family transcriptional regulator, leucine-responsive regulatory protein